MMACNAAAVERNAERVTSDGYRSLSTSNRNTPGAIAAAIRSQGVGAAGAGPSADDAAKVTELCMTAGRSLLLSDISQSGAAGAVVFPPDHKDVVLKEVVRNSSRIVTASLPFCRSVDLDDVTCIHGVRGPPLEPFMFNHCGGDGIARYTKYVEGIIHGLKHMNDTFPGVEIHDNLVILVPDLKFKDELQRRLTLAINEQIPAPGMSIVGAVDGAFAERKRREREPSRIVLDTLESFDGMERLFVFAVGLDSVKTTEGCCGIYRAITRAHMFVCVVQEHLKGGWLEFTAAIQSDGHVDFDEAKERERVARENLIVIESSGADEAAATSHVEQKGNASKENADQNTSSNNGNITVAGEVKVDLFDRTADGLNAANPIQGIESPKINLARKDDRVDEEAPSLVLTSNVWGTNLNSKAFSGTISNLSFNPINPNTLQDKWTVIASFVVVREHASLSSTEVHRLAHGDEVYVVGQETLADADRTERLQISTSSGIVGWVTRHLASSVPGESSGTTLLVPAMNPTPPQEFDEKAIRVDGSTPASSQLEPDAVQPEAQSYEQFIRSTYPGRYEKLRNACGGEALEGRCGLTKVTHFIARKDSWWGHETISETDPSIVGLMQSTQRAYGAMMAEKYAKTGKKLSSSEDKSQWSTFTEKDLLQGDIPFSRINTAGPLLKAVCMPPEVIENPHGIGCSGCERYTQVSGRKVNYYAEPRFKFCSSCLWLQKNNLPVKWEGRAPFWHEHHIAGYGVK